MQLIAVVEIIPSLFVVTRTVRVYYETGDRTANVT